MTNSEAFILSKECGYAKEAIGQAYQAMLKVKLVAPDDTFPIINEASQALLATIATINAIGIMYPEAPSQANSKTESE